MSEIPIVEMRFVRYGHEAETKLGPFFHMTKQDLEVRLQGDTIFTPVSKIYRNDQTGQVMVQLSDGTPLSSLP